MKRLMLIMILCIIISPANAQNYVLNKQVLVCGSEITSSASFSLNNAFGFSLIVDASSESYNCDIGFWPVILNQPIGGGYKYLPGDASMAAIQWPPAVLGGDVTYLVNYFRGVSAPCHLDGFYASADVNGDCMVITSDVTYLVNYFRGVNPLLYCPGYQSDWPPVPSQQPDDWPGCD